MSNAERQVQNVEVRIRRTYESRATTQLSLVSCLPVGRQVSRFLPAYGRWASGSVLILACLSADRILAT